MKLPDFVTRHVGALFVGLAVLSGVLFYGNVREQADRADCQAKYNVAFAESLSLRSKFSGDRQNAVDEVIAGVGRLIANPPKTPAEQKKAGEEYVRLFTNFDKVSRANEAARTANPLPTLPDC